MTTFEKLRKEQEDLFDRETRFINELLEAVKIHGVFNFIHHIDDDYSDDAMCDYNALLKHYLAIRDIATRRRVVKLIIPNATSDTERHVIRDLISLVAGITFAGIHDVCFKSLSGRLAVIRGTNDYDELLEIAEKFVGLYAHFAKIHDDKGFFIYAIGFLYSVEELQRTTGIKTIDTNIAFESLMRDPWATVTIRNVRTSPETVSKSKAKTQCDVLEPHKFQEIHQMSAEGNMFARAVIGMHGISRCDYINDVANADGTPSDRAVEPYSLLLDASNYGIDSATCDLAGYHILGNETLMYISRENMDKYVEFGTKVSFITPHRRHYINIKKELKRMLIHKLSDKAVITAFIERCDAFEASFA